MADLSYTYNTAYLNVGQFIIKLPHHYLLASRVISAVSVGQGLWLFRTKPIEKP